MLGEVTKMSYRTTRLPRPEAFVDQLLPGLGDGLKCRDVGQSEAVEDGVHDVVEAALRERRDHVEARHRSARARLLPL